MAKTYIKTGEKIYCTGCRLIVTDTENLELDTAEDDMYYDGLLVNWDENGYYTETA